jgi:hypothetical protein
MMPEIATRGLLLIQNFFLSDPPMKNKDLELSYPDLSKYEIYTKSNK